LENIEDEDDDKDAAESRLMKPAQISQLVQMLASLQDQGKLQRATYTAKKRGQGKQKYIIYRKTIP
jgi:hypothetical protein